VDQGAAALPELPQLVSTWDGETLRRFSPIALPSTLWMVAAMAEASGILMAPHACEGPVGAVASTHVDAAMPNFLVQEICSGVEPDGKDALWEELLGYPAMRMVDGYYPLPDRPGLGVDLDEAALARYPFGGTKPFVLLPVHEDGSIASP
jgi:galactonate dehydratase